MLLPQLTNYTLQARYVTFIGEFDEHFIINDSYIVTVNKTAVTPRNETGSNQASAPKGRPKKPKTPKLN